MYFNQLILETYYVEEDLCLNCEEGYIPNESHIICHQKIQNCHVYVEYNSIQNQVSCLECLDRYYLKSDVQCELIPYLPFCVEYSKDSPHCLKCNSNGFLHENRCLRSPDLGNCAQIMLTETSYFCERCEDDSFLFNSTCKLRSIKLENVNNCKSMNPGEDRCGKCKEDFNLNYNHRECLPLVKGCILYKENSNRNDIFECAKCEEIRTFIKNLNI